MKICASQKGFTLLEILVASAILTIVLGVIYSSFFSASKTSELVESNEDVYQTARSLIQMLSHEIRAIYYDPNSQQGLKGNSDSIHFLTSSYQRKGPDTKEGFIAEIGYFLDAHSVSDRTYLVKSVDPTLDSDFEAGGKLYPLTDGVEEMKFTYYNEETDEWLDEWSSEAAEDTQGSQDSKRLALPALIKMEFSILDEDENASRFHAVVQPNLYRVEQ